MVLWRSTALLCCVLHLLHTSWRNILCDTKVWQAGKDLCWCWGSPDIWAMMPRLCKRVSCRTVTRYHLHSSATDLANRRFTSSVLPLRKKRSARACSWLFTGAVAVIKHVHHSLNLPTWLRAALWLRVYLQLYLTHSQCQSQRLGHLGTVKLGVCISASCWCLEWKESQNGLGSKGP